MKQTQIDKTTSSQISSDVNHQKTLISMFRNNRVKVNLTFNRKKKNPGESGHLITIIDHK